MGESPFFLSQSNDVAQSKTPSCNYLNIRFSTPKVLYFLFDELQGCTEQAPCNAHFSPSTAPAELDSGSNQPYISILDVFSGSESSLGLIAGVPIEAPNEHKRLNLKIQCLLRGATYHVPLFPSTLACGCRSCPHSTSSFSSDRNCYHLLLSIMWWIFSHPISSMGDLLHLASFVILFLKIKSRHSCAGTK